LQKSGRGPPAQVLRSVWAVANRPGITERCNVGCSEKSSAVECGAHSRPTGARNGERPLGVALDGRGCRCAGLLRLVLARSCPVGQLGACAWYRLRRRSTRWRWRTLQWFKLRGVSSFAMGEYARGLSGVGVRSGTERPTLLDACPWKWKTLRLGLGDPSRRATTWCWRSLAGLCAGASGWSLASAVRGCVRGSFEKPSYFAFQDLVWGSLTPSVRHPGR